MEKCHYNWKYVRDELSKIAIIFLQALLLALN